MAKTHWTQTPAGRKKMARIRLAATAAIRRRTKNGEATSSQNGGRSLAREELRTLAQTGARVRLRELEREMTRLRVFLGAEPGHEDRK